MTDKEPKKGIDLPGPARMVMAVERPGGGRIGAVGPRIVMRKLVCAVLLCWLITTGCSTTARDRLKHWFFDIPATEPRALARADVGNQSEPRPTAPGTVETLSEPSLLLPKYASYHPPFVERECRQCHDAAQRMQPRADFLDSCRTCHPRFFSEEVGHPPVEQGQCTECHNMHHTDQRFLLTMPMFDLCVDCHDEPEDLSERAHTVSEVERCTACHDPHFGSNALLKPDPAIEIPG